MAKILIVEDDAILAEKVKDWLSAEHHLLEVTGHGDDALHLLRVYKYDLVILDWDLPGMTGMDILKRLRTAGDTMPVLMLTGKSEIPDKEAGFDAGADDYLTKPFHLKELSARIRALLRRAAGTPENVLKCGDLILDPSAHQVAFHCETIQLLPKEFALLEFFMRHPNQVFSGDDLLEHVWASEAEASSNTVRTFVYTLRKKLAAVGHEPPIETMRGVGYKLVSNP